MEGRVNEYSLLFSANRAHKDGIWALAYGRIGEGSNVNSATDEKAGSSASSHRVGLEAVVTGGIDGLVKIWNVENDGLREKCVLRGHAMGVVGVALNHEGTLIASSAMDATLRLWNAATGEAAGCIDLHQMDTSHVVFTRDSRYVVVGGYDGKVKMYSVESKSEEWQLNSKGAFLYTVAVSPDGKYIASAGLDGFINVFDYTTKRMVLKMDGHASAVRSLVFSPDSRLVMSSSDDNCLRLYDLEEGNATCEIAGHFSWVLSADFSSDMRYYASSSADKTVKIWDFTTHRCLHTFKHHQEEAWGVRFSESSNRVVSVSEDRAINLYGIPA